MISHHVCLLLQVGLLVLLPIVVIIEAPDPLYTEKETRALEKFRITVKKELYRDYMSQDKYLIRWLRAKSLDVQEASKMLRKAHKWRKSNGIDGILNETILNFPLPIFYNDGFSYYGRPAVTFSLDRFDLRRLVNSGHRNKAIRYMDQLLETGEQGLNYINKLFKRYEITEVVFIIDLKGFNLRQHACLGCPAFYVQWIRHYENYFPLLVKHMIFINTPRVFFPFFDLLKPLLSPWTQKALQVYGPNKKEWTSALFKLIPPNQLRHQFGGTKPELVLCATANFTCASNVFFRQTEPGL